MHLASNVRKCVDMMLGIAIGDAYGGPFENLPGADIDPSALCESYGSNPIKNNRPGHYTDDTQMSIALAEHICSGVSFNHESLADRFLECYRRDRRPGYSKRTRTALDNASSGADLICAPERKSTRNGSMMRAVPLGVIGDLEKLIEYAIINSETTHCTPPAKTASATVALASHYFLWTDGDYADVGEFVLDNLKGFDDASRDYLHDAVGMDRLDPVLLFGPGKDGVPVDGIRTAGAILHILGKHPGTWQALRQSILLGGDTDTTAAVATGISALRYGLSDLPNGLLSGLEKGPYGEFYLSKLGKRLAAYMPINVQSIRRFNYSGIRKRMIVHGLDGLIEPIDPVYLNEIMRRLFMQISYLSDDLILGVDSSGYIPALAASHLTGLQVVNSKKANLDVDDRLVFLEPGTPNPEIFVYRLPTQSRIIIVDDEILTGKTVINLARALRQSGHYVLGAVVPVESSCHDARERLKQEGVSLISHTIHRLG
jgi:ADP-ribosyl-[dinitrogen reductase] hydrolase